MEKAPTRIQKYELSLDFSNTVDWRKGKRRDDSLKSFDTLLTWCAKHGILSGEEIPSQIRGTRDEKLGEGTLKKAIQLRETIYRIFSAVAHEQRPREEDLGVLNKFLADYPARPMVVRSGQDYQWNWIHEKGTEGGMLWPIAKSAADLLTSDQLERVTECANEDEGCGWIFLDMTRSKTRKWCSMTGCGNRVKVRTWYGKHEKAQR